MDTVRSPIRVVAVALGVLLMQVGAASAQHGGGGHSGGGGHYGGGGHSGGGGHYRGGGHYGGYYGGGHYGGNYRSHYYPRFYLYGGLYGYYGYPFYYGYPYSYGYGYPFYRYGAYGYGGDGNGGYEYRDSGAVRLQVEPDEARVFVDGYYAGIADDFNGRSDRLTLPAGRHEIVLKLDGYKTHRIEIDLAGEQTVRIRYRMGKGTGEDVEDLTPHGYRDEPRGSRGEEQQDTLSGPAPSGDRGKGWRGEQAENRGHGGAELRLTVRPADAVVYVDGEFRGPGGQRRLELPPGRHSIQAVRPGFQTFERVVELEGDIREDLDVELRPAE